MILSSIAPQFRGTGLATGLEHRFRYVARLSNNAGGQNGNSWIVTSLPYLHYSEATVDDMPEKVVLMGAGGDQWEWETGTGYRGLHGTRRRLTAEGADFRMFDPDGGSSTFHGPDVIASLRGRLKNAVSALGIVTAVAYDGNQRIASETRTDPQTGNQAGLFYTFATDGPHAGRILAVEKRFVLASVAHPLHRWLFTYHDGGDGAGSLNDLETAEEQVWDVSRGTWASAGKRYFRYYKDNTSIGFVHGLRYVLDADGYARMAALGLDPGNTAQVSDAILGGVLRIRRRQAPQQAREAGGDGDEHLRPTPERRRSGTQLGEARDRDPARRGDRDHLFQPLGPPRPQDPRVRRRCLGGLLGIQFAEPRDPPRHPGRHRLLRRTGQRLAEFQRRPEDRRRSRRDYGLLPRERGRHRFRPRLP